MNEKLASYLTTIWDRAQKAKVGLCIEATDPLWLQTRLYEARKALGKYEEMSIVLPDKEGEVWIVKKDILTPPSSNWEDPGTFESMETTTAKSSSARRVLGSFSDD